MTSITIPFQSTTSSITVGGAVSGGISNFGTISPGGIYIAGGGSLIGSDVAGRGGIQCFAHTNGGVYNGGGVINGGITNAGVLSSTPSGGTTAIAYNGIPSFTGGITNSGTIYGYYAIAFNQNSLFSGRSATAARSPAGLAPPSFLGVCRRFWAGSPIAD